MMIEVIREMDFRDWYRTCLDTVLVAAEVLFDAAAFFAVADLADLFWGEFFFVAALFAAGHDGAEGFDFSDDGGEVECPDLGFDGLGVFVSDRGFGEVGLSVEPADIDVAGVVFNEVTTVVGGPMFLKESGSGEVAPGPVGSEGMEGGVVVSKNNQDGGSHVERD